ncbi:TPA: glycosyltransferase family 2 protein [Legionella pneumophila]|nr:glycosyltransferase family 2 protein [Legionella sp.]OJY50303.1 MAG: glycosyl transferase [Legionella sp. 40-6]
MEFKNMAKVVVIIPTYNESEIIEKTIHEVFSTMSINNIMVHVLIFDSCSTDKTQEIVRNLQLTYPHLHLQIEPRKTGLGSAYLQAMQYSLYELNADIIFEFDADLSHQPHYLPEMLRLMEAYKADAVIGSRYVRGGSIPKNWGWHRKSLSILGNFVARTFLTPKYKDFTSGFRATNYLALKKILPQQFISNHYAYKLELLWRLHKSKAKIIEYPIAFIDRELGKSKLPANSIIDSLRVLTILRYREFKSYFRMCGIGVIGMLIQYVLYNLLRMEYSPFIAAQIAVSIAILNNYILNNRITFKKCILNNQLKSIFIFAIYSIFTIIFQSKWAQLGVNYFGGGYIKENLIIAVGIVIGSFLNYIFYSRIIWNNKSQIELNAS